MRLIDAEELIENLLYDVALDEKILDDMDFVGNSRELIQFDKDCKQNAIEFLRNAPTINTESGRKKGEWIELSNSNHNYICSLCGRMLVGVTDGKNRVAKNYPFCHCGADMREGTE